jgi:hypothetical protein
MNSLLFKKNESPIISYYTLRILIGILGMALPFTVIIGGFIQNQYCIEGSISSYYYTNMRDYFVGLLCGVGLFLFTYRGPEKIDVIVTDLCGLFALGIIIFPTSFPNGNILKVGIFQLDPDTSGYFHLTFASLFFITLALNSMFLFTRSKDVNLTAKKIIRNRIYRACGIVILASLVCIIIYIAFLKNTVISKSHPILIFETTSLIAFGISWLIKGKTLFR